MRGHTCLQQIVVADFADAHFRPTYPCPNDITQPLRRTGELSMSFARPWHDGDRLIEDAKKAGSWINPICPYADDDQKHVEDDGKLQQDLRSLSPRYQSGLDLLDSANLVVDIHDLGRPCWGLKFIISHLYLCGRPQKHKVPTNGTWNWSPGLIVGAPCIIFRAGARPKAPGARRGPQGAENRLKIRGRIYHFIVPKVCPENASQRATTLLFCWIEPHTVDSPIPMKSAWPRCSDAHLSYVTH